jgi:hypothetical protein
LNVGHFTQHAKTSDTGSEPKVFIDNASYPKWIKSSLEGVTFHVRYQIDRVDTSVSARKHANVAEQGSNELISVLGGPRLPSKTESDTSVVSFGESSRDWAV